MTHIRAFHGLLITCTLLLAVLVQGCGGSGPQVHEVPPDGYEATSNYQFQARVESNDQGTCQRMTVRVRPLNKLYVDSEEPPDRLQLVDDDCQRPIEFDRATYVSEESGPVQLSGTELIAFWNENAELEHELTEWLFQSGLL